MNKIRELPNDRDAEEYLLACIFLDGNETISKCIEARLTPLAFHHEPTRIILAKAIDLFTEGKPVDMQVIASELRATKQMAAIGDYAFLVHLSQLIPTTSQVGHFIERINELYLLREMIRTATAAAESCYAYTDGGVAESVAPYLAKMQTLAVGSTDAQEKDWNAVLDESERELKSLIENKGPDKSRIINFPWPRMDDLFAPMQRSQLVIIAARPSVGKSSLARPLLAAAAAQGHKAYFVTLEVKPMKVPLQIAASLAGTGLRQVAYASPNAQRIVLEALSSLKGMGVTISSKDRSLSRITARARALKSKGDLDIMFIDHGGCIEDVYAAPNEGKLQAIERTTKVLKSLAVELDIVVVLLWQLNRESAKQANREPTMTDLKACGSLEEDADKILLIHRPDKDPIRNIEQHESMGVAELPTFYQNVIQAKGRDDGTSLMSFNFERQTASFRTIEKPIQPNAKEGQF